MCRNPRPLGTLQVDEDSSYDSDTEAAAISSPHKNVSRNGSETLAQELEDFNSSVSNNSPSNRPPIPLAIAHMPPSQADPIRQPSRMTISIRYRISI